MTVLHKVEVNIHELEKLTGQPARNIRFLIAEGIVPEPHGKVRWASYGEEHVGIGILCGAESAGDHVAERHPGTGGKRANGEEQIVIAPLPGVEIRIVPSAIRDIDINELSRKIRAALESAVSQNKKED